MLLRGLRCADADPRRRATGDRVNAPARARRLHPPPLPSADRLYAERCRRKFSYFVREAWKEIEQGRPVGFDGGYLDVICDHAEATYRGAIKNCVVNVINRSLKSQVASVFLNAWIWINNPAERVLSGAWQEDLAIRDARKTRELVTSAWYERIKRDVFGDRAWSLVGDQNQKQFFENTAGGYRQTTHVGGGTGKGGDFLIGDDLLGIDQSRSDVETESAREWVLRTFMGRRNNPQTSRVFVVGHRLRTDDPYGALIAKRELGFVHVPLPLEFDPGEKRPPTPIEWVDRRKEKGESLCPDRWGPAEIEQAKAMFEDLYEAIANQRPSATKHRPIKPEYIKRYTTLPAKLRIVDTWDTSFKGMDVTQRGAKRSRTAGLKLGFDQANVNVYFLGHWCDFADFNDQQDQITAMADETPGRVDTLWIEAEANGDALISVFKKLHRTFTDSDGRTRTRPIATHVLGSRPEKSKYLRLLACSRFFREGRVWFPPDDAFPWVAGLVRRLTEFPSVEFDDEIDALSQALREEWLPKDEDDTTGGGEKLKASVRW